MAEIRAALDAGLYYAAVSMTLSVPDICSALETNAGHSRFGKIEPRYKAWCKQYMEPRFGSFDADDCWALRGGVIHNAMLSKHPKNTRGRLLLMPPNDSQNIVHELVVRNCGDPPESGLQLYIPQFCEMMIEVATEWYEAEADNPIVQQNLPDLVRYRPEGMAPYMVGLPVIA